MWPHVLARQDSAVLVLQTHRPPRAKTRSGGNNRRGGEAEAREERRARARESGETGEGAARGAAARAGRRRERGSGGRAGVRVGGGWRGPPAGGAGRLAAGRAVWGWWWGLAGRPNSPSPASERASERARQGKRKGGEARERSPRQDSFKSRGGGAGGLIRRRGHARRCVISPSPEGGRLCGFLKCCV